MTRYSERTKDDLYNEISYRFDESKMSLGEFVKMLLEIIADLISNEGSRL